MTNDQARLNRVYPVRLILFVIRASSLIRYSGFVIRVSLAALLLLAFAGCDRSVSSKSAAPQLVLYSSVDEPYVKPIVAEFEAKTGIQVVVQTDTEATKSAGLAARLEAERDNPRADVWWGNEVFHTIRLADAGLLTPYASAAAKDVAAKYRDAEHRWAGVGLRARVIAVHVVSGETQTAPAVSIHDLLRAEHKGKVAIARPTAGTTGGHVASLYVLWGPARFPDFFKKLKANDVKLLGGNGAVAEAIARGEIAVGLTDNDDVASARRNGGTLAAGLPDQDTIGTLAIPTTVGLVTGTRHPDAAKQLVDYLLSPEVERRLIDAKFAGWSVRDPENIRTMDVDFAAAARAMPQAVEQAMTILEGRE